MTNNTSLLTLIVETSNAHKAVLMISCAIAITANIFVMALILAVRQLKTATNVFVFSLCQCNAIISILVIPMRIFVVSQGGYASLAYRYIVMITILIYICNLVAVAHHRLLCITEPMTYMQTQTKRQVLKIVLVTWIAPLIYGLLPSIWFNQPMSPIEKQVHETYLMVTLICLLVPMIYMIYVFIRIYEQAKNIKKHEQSLFPKPQFDIAKNIGSHQSLVAGNQNRKHYLVCFGSKRILMKFLCSYSEASKFSADPIRETSELPEVVLVGPSPELKQRENDPGNNLLRVYHASTPRYDNRQNNDNQILSSHHSLSSLSNNESIEGDQDTMINTSGASPSNTDDTTSLSSTGQVGNMLRKARSASIISIVSITRRSSAINFKQLLQQKTYELKASLAFLIAVSLYLITWIPVVALTLVDVIDKDIKVPDYVEVISLYTIALNALVEPFVYGLLLPSFRRILKLSLHRWMDKMSVSETSRKRYMTE